MDRKKTTSAHRQLRASSIKLSNAYHHLDALLHTMRCISQYEDILCELSHEAKRAGDLSPEISEELRGILEKIPAHEYVLDLEAVKGALVEPHTSRRVGSRKPAESAPVRKSPTPAKKKSRRASSR